MLFYEHISLVFTFIHRFVIVVKRDFDEECHVRILLHNERIVIIQLSDVRKWDLRRGLFIVILLLKLD